MDTEKAILSALYTHIANDSQLDTVCSGVRLGLIWTPKDETFPYLVHRLTAYADDSGIVQRADYFLDLWDHGDSATKIYSMRERAVALLDKACIVQNGEGFAVIQSDEEMSGNLIVARLRLASFGLIPEDVDKIWHYSMTFTVRFMRSISEITNLT